MASPGASRPRQIFFSAVLLIIGLTFALVAGELLMRVVSPPVFENHMRVYDPELGWIAKPETLFYRPTGRAVRFEANAMGYRDHKHTRARTVRAPDGAQRRIKRIMVFGDSFTESAQVEIHETFWSLLKDRLNSRQSDTYWEVQAFGVGDWGTLQEWLAYREHGQLADIVILQVFPLNDIANNSIDAANMASSQDAYRPYLDPRTDFRSITYLNPRTSWLRQNTHLGRFLVQLAIQKRGPWGREKTFKTLQERMDYSNVRAKELGMGEMKFPSVLFNTLAYKPDQFEPFQTGWRATDIAIRRFVNLTKGRHQKLMVMVTPHLDQLHPYSEKLKELPFPAHPDYPERRITNLLAKDDVSVIPLLADFQANMDKVSPYLEGHFTRDAHHLVAAKLEAKVLELFPIEGVEGQAPSPPKTEEPESQDEKPGQPDGADS